MRGQYGPVAARRHGNVTWKDRRDDRAQATAVGGHVRGELLRWYWLKSELVGLARELGVRTAGGKGLLTDRLVAALDGGALPAGDPPAGEPPAGAKIRKVGRTTELQEPLTETTVLPAGQRCTQQLRRFFVAHIGSSFRFDAHMRDFIGSGAGRTLAEGIDHWRRSRAWAAPPIGPQFELNQFLRDWHRTHLDQTHADALLAWKRHRATPVDARPDR